MRGRLSLQDSATRCSPPSPISASPASRPSRPRPRPPPAPAPRSRSRCASRNSSARAELLARLADTWLDQGGAPAEALDPARSGLAAIPTAEARSLAAGLDARLALARGDAPAARALLQSALLAESQRPLPARLPLLRLRLAEADPADREAHVRAAYEALEKLRPLLPRFDPLTEETAFSLYMRGVFSARSRSNWRRPSAAEPIRMRGAQQIVEAYRQAELQSAFGSECLPPRDRRAARNLAAGEMLLYPMLLPDRVELLYVTGGDGRRGGRPTAGCRPTARRPPGVARLVERWCSR